MLDKVSDGKIAVADDPSEEDMDLETPAHYALEDLQKPTGKSFGQWVLASILLLVQIALVIAVLFAALMMTKQMIAEKPEPRKRPAFKTVYTIDTVKAVQADRQPKFTAYGQTVAARTVDLRALVSGEIIRVSDKLRTGARVAKGDPLLEIDGFNYKGALSEAQANLAEAQARVSENEAQVGLEESKLGAAREQLAFAEDDLARAVRLMQRKTSTQKEVDSRKLIVSQRKQGVALSVDTIKVQQARLAQLKSSIDRLQWRVDQAERNLASTILTAPFAGIVRSSTAEMGRVITANDVVVSLYEADTLEVKFTLTDAQYGRLQTSANGLVGRPVEVNWFIGGQQLAYPATIDRVGADITSNRGGVEVFALVGKANNAVTFRPGAFVEVSVPDKTFKSTFAVPDTAIYGTDTVYTAVDGQLVENKVTIVAFEGETAFISDGLKPGDEVLTTRITEVSAGLRVRKEGDPIPQRGDSRGAGQGKAKPEGGTPAARTGRPTPEEIGEILKANDMTREAFQALSRPERRKLIQAHRAGQ